MISKKDIREDVVYFLYDINYNIIYIGITDSIERRIRNHRLDKDFHDHEIAYTNINGIDIGKRLSEVLETYLVDCINPKLNICKKKKISLNFFQQDKLGKIYKFCAFRERGKLRELFKDNKLLSIFKITYIFVGTKTKDIVKS